MYNETSEEIKQENQQSDFYSDLCQLLIRYKIGERSNTPDHLLVFYIKDCLKAYEQLLAMQRPNTDGVDLNRLMYLNGIMFNRKDGSN